MQRQEPGAAIDQGKSGCKISVWLTEELCAAIAKAQRKSEVRSDCVVRLLLQALRQ